MAELEESGGKKKKKQKAAKTPTGNTARGRYKVNRPDLRRKLIRIIHSNNDAAGLAFVDKNDKDYPGGLMKIVAKANEKKKAQKDRRIARDGDPVVHKRRIESRLETLRTKYMNITKAIKERKDVEARIRETQAKSPEDPVDPNLVQWLDTNPDYPEMHAARSKVKEKLEKLESHWASLK